MIFEKGQRVAVRTVNGGGRGTMVASKRPPKVENWTGRVVCASPMGGPWWVVRKIGKSARTYTVPAAEMTKIPL